MDVCLTSYGHCNYVSGKHACIFYDEVSAQAAGLVTGVTQRAGRGRSRPQVAFVCRCFVDGTVSARAVNGFTPAEAASALSVKPSSEARGSASVVSPS